MFDNGTSSTLDVFSFESYNGSLPSAADFDILFQPDVVLIALYVIVIFVSFTANVLLIVVAVKCKYTKNVTNIFLVNLSVADLLVTVICMPIQLSKAITLVWFYGNTVCKLVNYMQGVSVAASVFTITAMSVGRWASVSSRWSVRPPGRRQALLLLAAVWLAALLALVPLLVVAAVRIEPVPVITRTAHRNLTVFQYKEMEFCTEEWSALEKRRDFGVFSFTLVYAIPGSIMIVSYVCMGRTLCTVRPPIDFDEGRASMQKGNRMTKERKRMAWILLLLAVLFAMCWLPYNIMQLLLDIYLVDAKALSSILPYALFLGHANSAINPIVYCLMTRNFQRSVRKVLCGKGLCQQNNMTWRCTREPEKSSSDYELYHGPHKRCYLQMRTLRPTELTPGPLGPHPPRTSHVTGCSGLRRNLYNTHMG